MACAGRYSNIIEGQIVTSEWAGPSLLSTMPLEQEFSTVEGICHIDWNSKLVYLQYPWSSSTLLNTVTFSTIRIMRPRNDFAVCVARNSGTAKRRRCRRSPHLVPYGDLISRESGFTLRCLSPNYAPAEWISRGLRRAEVAFRGSA